MTDPVEHLRWHEWARDALTEKRPAPLSMTDTERIDWLGEHCDRHEYVYPTKTTIGHHVIIDCMGQRTTAANYRDAIDAAAAKFKEANQ